MPTPEQRATATHPALPTLTTTSSPAQPPIVIPIWFAPVGAEGETAVVVCGALGLNAAVRTQVAKVSDEMAVHKGSGLQGVYLHAEDFCR